MIDDMIDMEEKYVVLIDLLRDIRTELRSLSETFGTKSLCAERNYIFVSFKGSEIYLLHKAFIDSGGAPNENYKSLLEKTLPALANKTQRGFSAQSFCKYSDKVDPQSKEMVKRFLQRMIRNIESYD